jgi:hypothetical protein
MHATPEATECAITPEECVQRLETVARDVGLTPERSSFSTTECGGWDVTVTLDSGLKIAAGWSNALGYETPQGQITVTVPANQPVVLSSQLRIEFTRGDGHKRHLARMCDVLIPMFRSTICSMLPSAASPVTDEALSLPRYERSEQ